MTEAEELKVCSICQNEYYGWSNNAWPVNEGRCCKECDDLIVIPARIRMMMRSEKGKRTTRTKSTREQK